MAGIAWVLQLRLPAPRKRAEAERYMLANLQEPVVVERGVAALHEPERSALRATLEANGFSPAPLRRGVWRRKGLPALA